MRRALIAAAAAVLIAAAGPASAQSWLNSPGSVGATTVEVGHAKLTLPPGEWKLAAENTSMGRGAKGLTYVNRVYYQVEGDRIAAMVGVRANATEKTGHNVLLGAPKQCDRHDVFLNDDKNILQGTFDCMLVSHAMMTWGATDPLWGPARQAMAAVGGLPRPTVYAEFNKAGHSGWDSLVVQVFFNPAVAGFTSSTGQWADSEWHPNNATPDRVAYLNKVAVWARAYRAVVAKALE
jgi:hypothetical protein